jgi:NAD(P)-dependent dehydrogenase (short-subunit alcohol dehydrogenase family)
MNDPFFHDKVAVVTGAGGTLCSVISKALAAKGTKVALLGRTLSSLEKVATEIRSAGGTALAAACDATNGSELERARETVLKELGVPWFLVNGAGGTVPEAMTTTTEFNPIELTPGKPAELRGFFNLQPQKVEDVLVLNTMGTILPSQVFGRDMAAQGRGSILTFGSMTSYRALSRVAPYTTAKTGMLAFTQWLAAYLAPAGVRVNGIAPGWILNTHSRKILTNPDGSLTSRGQNVIQHTAVKRFGEAEELLGTVMWLLNDEQSRFVTGIMVPVDGGFLASPGI